MNVVTTEASDAVLVHGALDEVVALHSVLMTCAVREVREGCLAQLVLFELPEVFEVQALVKSNRPVVILSFNRILQRLSLGVTLNASVVGAHEVQFGRVHDRGGSCLG